MKPKYSYHFKGRVNIIRVLIGWVVVIWTEKHERIKFWTLKKPTVVDTTTQNMANGTIEKRYYRKGKLVNTEYE